jgi:hypothetical protein
VLGGASQSGTAVRGDGVREHKPLGAYEVENMSWSQLQDIYQKKGIVLALGAGVSLDSKLPNWIGLLKRLGSKCLGVDGDKAVAQLIAEGFSLPAIANMLRLRCPSDTKFSDLVRAALYQDFEPYKQRNVGSVLLGKLLEEACSENYTLRAVAALCVRWDKNMASFLRNDKIHAIVNFNLDALLMEYVAVRYKRGLVRSVERASKSRDPEKTNIYYMHGFLRFDSKANDPDKEAFDKLVLSEQEYFDFFNSPTSLFNYTFLYVLREYSCLFIGLSMQDDNIRRLLHYSKKERQVGYEEEKKEKHEAESSPDEIKEKLRRHFAIIKEYDSGELKDLVEMSLAELGVNVLWINDYKQIPKKLEFIYGADWRKVY